MGIPSRTMSKVVATAVRVGIAGAICVVGGSTACRADVITPLDVRGTSEFGAVDVFGDGNFSDVYVTDLIDGGGLIDVEGTPDFVLDDLHDYDFSSTNGWHAGDFDAGIAGGLDEDGDPLTPPPVDQQILEFDLGGRFQLTHAHVWQQNQGPLFGPAPAELRGVEEFRWLVATSTVGEAFELLGTFELEPELGVDDVAAQVLTLETPAEARRVRFEIVSATSGESREFVGLSEVRFEGTPVATLPGDIDLDGDVDAADMDRLSLALRQTDPSPDFDLNADGLLSQADRDFWVAQLRQTWFGDANLDGEFNSTDFVVAFTAGQYEDGVPANSSWATGDWNGDAEFDSTDFVVAFVDGGYDAGPRPQAAPVPEPTFGSLLMGLLVLAMSRNLVSQLNTRHTV